MKRRKKIENLGEELQKTSIFFKTLLKITKHCNQAPVSLPPEDNLSVLGHTLSRYSPHPEQFTLMDIVQVVQKILWHIIVPFLCSLLWSFEFLEGQTTHY